MRGKEIFAPVGTPGQSGTCDDSVSRGRELENLRAGIEAVQGFSTLPAQNTLGSVNLDTHCLFPMCGLAVIRLDIRDPSGRHPWADDYALRIAAGYIRILHRPDEAETTYPAPTSNPPGSARGQARETLFQVTACPVALRDVWDYENSCRRDGSFPQLVFSTIHRWSVDP